MEALPTSVLLLALIVEDDEAKFRGCDLNTLPGNGRGWLPLDGSDRFTFDGTGSGRFLLD